MDDAARGDPVLGYADNLRRPGASRTGNKRYARSAWLRSNDGQRIVEADRQSGGDRDDSDCRSRPDLHLQQLSAEPADLRDSRRWNGRHFAQAERNFKPIRRMEHAARRDLHADAVDLWRILVHLRQPRSDGLLQSKDRRAHLSTAY